MLLDKTFRVEPTGYHRWQYSAIGVLVLLGTACSLETLQPAHSADTKIYTAGSAESKAEKKAKQADETAADAAKEAGNTQPAKESSSAVGVLSGTALGENIIPLPGYPYLTQGDVVKELNITPEQKKKLHEIQAKFASDRKAFYAKLRNLSRTLPKDERMKARKRWVQEQYSRVRKQVEQVLTPPQAQLLEELTLHELAFAYLSNPEVVAKLSLTDQQQLKLRRMEIELLDWGTALSKQTTEKALAVLSPKQQAQLREAALGPLEPHKYGLQAVSRHYLNFGGEEVHRQLGLSPAQQQQVREILGGASLAEKVKKDHYEQRAELEGQSSVKTTVKLLRQFEGLLTPEQLASYRDIAFRSVVRSAIRQSTIRGDHSLILRQIGASDQQRAALWRILMESLETGGQLTRKIGEKMLEVLTPPQREKLHEEIDQRLSGRSLDE